VRDAYAELSSFGITAIGINGDSLDSHQGYHEELELPFPLLSDPTRSVAGEYGVLKPDGLRQERTVLVVDKNRVIVYREQGAPSVSAILDGVNRYGAQLDTGL